MLTVFFTALCFSSSISVLRYCIKWSPDDPIQRSRWKWRVASVRRSRWRWLVDLATKWLSCARKHIRRKTSNTQACEIHPFHAIQGKSIAWLRDSSDIIFLVKFNVEFTRQAMDFPIIFDGFACFCLVIFSILWVTKWIWASFDCVSLH